MVTFKKVLAQSFLWVILILIYLPVLMLIAYSFNDSTVLGVWSNDGWLNSGLTGELYEELFSSASYEIGIALGNTVIIAVTAAFVSTVFGTLGAVGAYYSKHRTATMLEGLTQISVVNADVVIALSLTVMFVMMGNYLFRTSIFSYWTLLIGHCVLATPFVYLNVKPKIKQMDPELYEAALDLNASPSVALRKIVLPQILPGIISGFMLAVSLSLDDFIITAFTTGPGLLSGTSSIVTLSTYVEAHIKKGPVPTALRPLTAIIFGLVLLTVIAYTVYNNRKSNRGNVHAAKRLKQLAAERKR